MAREFSAGGVVVRKRDGTWWIAAIEPRRDPVQSTALALPKGNVDKGEKPDQTALREVREETGLEATLVAKLTDIKYFYVRTWGDKQRVFKIVSFYLLRYRSGRIGNISDDMRHEVERALWIPLEEAPQRLSYRGERDVAKLAQEYLKNHPEDSS
ncbi:MAG TPA: NUDIX domain-containing protein [Terriglobales bacterium]|nr:NUDIX domain-containing protein [Terriglobales bacterium]